MRLNLEVGVYCLPGIVLKQGRTANSLQRGVGHFCGPGGLRRIRGFMIFTCILPDCFYAMFQDPVRL